MCELLGMSANVPTDICFSFTGLVQRGGGTGPHKDGWGITFYEGKGCRTFKDPQPSFQSPIAKLVQEYPIKSCSVIAHIRQANRGIVALENTHPFTRELWGPMRITASWRGMSLSRREICILAGKPIAKRRSAGCYIASPNAIRKCRETWLRFSGLSPRSPGSCVKKACLTCCSPMGATSWRFAQRIYTGLRDGRRLA